MFLSEQLPNARFFSTISPQIEYLTNRSKLGNNKKLYANIHGNSMDTFALDKGRLQLANSYTINNTGDCSYYLLNIWKQLGYDQEHDELHLTGDNVAYRQQVQNQLKEYLRRIFIINPQAEFNTSHTSRIEDIPFDIQALLICE